MFHEDEALYLIRKGIEQLYEEGYSTKEIIQEIKYILKDIQESE